MKSPLFTVFTPTFNRAHTLHRVYESLSAQTFKDFEWIIVDDGSTDETSELVKSWQEKASFPIRYYYQENAGKHIAFNRGVREAAGELFLPLDSDDACVPNALERLQYHWFSISEQERSGFTGVVALCQDQHGKLVGDAFPRSPLDATYLEQLYRYKVHGDKWGFNQTEILRRFPFPETSGEKLISESVVWTQISKQYKVRYVNERLRVYYQGEVDSLSGGNAKIRNLSSRQIAYHREVHYDIMNNHLDWFGYAPLTFVKSALAYVYYGFLSGWSLKRQWQSLNSWKAHLLWLVAILPGFMLVTYHKYRYSAQGDD